MASVRLKRHRVPLFRTDRAKGGLLRFSRRIEQIQSLFLFKAEVSAEHNKTLSRCKHCVRDELPSQSRLICHGPPRQGHIGIRAVLQFDPITEFSVLIPDSSRVLQRKLRNPKQTVVVSSGFYGLFCRLIRRLFPDCYFPILFCPGITAAPAAQHAQGEAQNHIGKGEMILFHGGDYTSFTCKKQ